MACISQILLRHVAETATWNLKIYFSTHISGLWASRHPLNFHHFRYWRYQRRKVSRLHRLTAQRPQRVGMM